MMQCEVENSSFKTLLYTTAASVLFNYPPCVLVLERKASSCVNDVCHFLGLNVTVFSVCTNCSLLKLYHLNHSKTIKSQALLTFVCVCYLNLSNM